jgi:hypothetical protein
LSGRLSLAVLYKQGTDHVFSELAASKLAAYRDKDRDFVRTLLIEQMIDAEILLFRVELLPVSEDIKQRLSKWIKATVADI